MAKIFMHSGIHKTGTTSIQVVFTAARSDLMREWQFLYPQTGCPPKDGKYGQHELAWSVIRRPSYLPPAWVDERPSQDIWERLREEIDASRANAVLISSEEFDCLTAEEIGDLGRFLQGYDVVPIMYFRRHPELIDSMYQTAIKYGYPHSIEYLSRICRTRFDYRQVVSDWSRIADDGRVLAFNYEKQKDIVSHLAQAIGVPESLLRLPRQRWNRNTGPSHMSDSLAQEIEARHAQEIAYWSQLS